MGYLKISSSFFRQFRQSHKKMISNVGKSFWNLSTIQNLTLLIFHPKPSSHRNKNISSKLVFLTKYPQQVHTVFKGYFEVRKVSMTLKIPFSLKQQNVSNALIWENWIAGANTQTKEVLCTTVVIKCDSIISKLILQKPYFSEMKLA